MSLFAVALASVAQAQYFYPQPSPPFEILPVVEETTTTARPIVTTQPAPVYVQCAFGQECLTASVCSSRPGQENTNFGAVSLFELVPPWPQFPYSIF